MSTNSTPRWTGCWSVSPQSNPHWPNAISRTAHWCCTTCHLVYGHLCAPDGCPVAIEVFDGNTADPMTLASQVEKLTK